MQIVDEGHSRDLTQACLNLLWINVRRGTFHQDTKTVPNKAIRRKQNQHGEEDCANRINNCPAGFDHNNDGGKQYPLEKKNGSKTKTTTKKKVS